MLTGTESTLTRALAAPDHALPFHGSSILSGSDTIDGSDKHSDVVVAGAVVPTSYV